MGDTVTVGVMVGVGLITKCIGFTATTSEKTLTEDPTITTIINTAITASNFSVKLRDFKTDSL